MIKRILIPTDGYGLEDHVISYVARAFPFAEFHVVSIVNTYERGVQMTTLLYDEMKKAAEEAIYEAEEKLKNFGIHDVKIALLEGLPSREIVRYAKAHDIALIAMRVYSRKHTASAHRLGSTVRNVLKRSRIPVLTVADEVTKLPIKRAVLLTDGTMKTKMAENFAILFSSSYNVEIEAVYFSPTNDEENGKRVIKNLEWKADHWGVKIKGKIIRKDLNEILHEISSGDIVIMGMGRKSMFGYEIGHATLYVVTHSPVPVILVPKYKDKRWSIRTLRK